MIQKYPFGRTGRTISGAAAMRFLTIPEVTKAKRRKWKLPWRRMEFTALLTWIELHFSCRVKIVR
jgi:hypothetical protein